MPLTLAGPTAGKERLQSHRLGFELDAVFQIFKRMQGEVEEIAGAAGRIEDGEGAQPVEEGATGRTFGVVALASAGRAGPRHCRRAPGAGRFQREPLSHSLSQGRVTTGSTICMILSRSV